MKNMAKILTIPGLSGTRKLEQHREESMRIAQMNLERQARGRIAVSMLGKMKISKIETTKGKTCNE